MPHHIQAVDKPGSAHVRTATRVAHLAYLDTHKDELLFAGALLDNDGVNAHGSIYILDTDDRAEAEAFIAGDPFYTAGLFEEVMVNRLRVAFLDGKCLL